MSIAISPINNLPAGSVRFGQNAGPAEKPSGGKKEKPAKTGASAGGKIAAGFKKAMAHAFNPRGLLSDVFWTAAFGTVALLIPGAQFGLLLVPFIMGTGIIFRMITGFINGYGNAGKHPEAAPKSNRKLDKEA